MLCAHGQQVRQDLLDDLLAGRPVAPGPRMAAAREAGLEPSAQCLVVVARPTAATVEEHCVRPARRSYADRAQVRP